MTVERTRGEIHDIFTAELATDPTCTSVRVLAISRLQRVPKEGNWGATFSDSSGKRLSVVAERTALAIQTRLQRKFHLIDQPR